MPSLSIMLLPGGAFLDIGVGATTAVTGLANPPATWKALIDTGADMTVISPKVDEPTCVVREAASAELDRFVLTSGHKVWEIRPGVTWNKGDALAWTIDRLGDASNRLVFYPGDDRTDEDAFARLPDGITAKVGSPEAPTPARYALPDPAAVHAFPGWLASRLSP